MSFRERYGPWALVAGASAGLGEAFARQLAARGLHLVLLARRQAVLDALSTSLRQDHGVEVRTLAIDLARPDLGEAVDAITRDLEVGLLVYNAAHSAIGPFLERPLEEQLRVVDVNVRGPLILAHRLGGPMARRGRGGIVLMASMAGGQGNPWLAAYAASKAFNQVFAEGLWGELERAGVDVLACRAGATNTPSYAASRPKRAVPMQEPEAVAAHALARLGRGPGAIPGLMNRVAAFLFARLFPRRVAIAIMGRATRSLYE